MNKNLLKAKMLTYGDNRESLAEALGIGISAMNYKITGNRDGRGFTQSEIQIIKDRYKLNPQEIHDIFFSGGENE